MLFSRTIPFNIKINYLGKSTSQKGITNLYFVELKPDKYFTANANLFKPGGNFRSPLLPIEGRINTGT